MTISKRRASAASTPELTRLSSQTQIDFELEFFAGILKSRPDFLDVLKAHAKNLALAKRHGDGVLIDQQIALLSPKDAIVHYNLACSYALTQQTEFAFDALRQAMELGYQDFRFIKRDTDLDGLRLDPRFRELIREFETKVRT